MSFFANSFVFDNVPSETYNIHITNLGENETYTNTSTSVDIITKSIFRRSVPYFYGASKNTVLTFPCAITSPEEITADVSRSISRWLFGQLEYKKLQIVQEDMQMSYFNCFLNNPQTLKVGNKIHGYQFEVQCDAPWAWEFEKTLTKTYSSDYVSNTFTFVNTSDDNDYLYPEVIITSNSFGGQIIITNHTDDSDRQFIFTALSAGEVVTIDNDRGIISSDTGLLRMDKFNKNWFRLLPGANSITIKARISSFVMNYNLARKVV